MHYNNKVIKTKNTILLTGCDKNLMFKLLNNSNKPSPTIYPIIRPIAVKIIVKIFFNTF